MRTCQDCARAMLLGGHCESESQHLTAKQAASMLWLCLICQDSATASQESRYLQELSRHPRKDGDPRKAPAVQLLAVLLSDPRRAASIEALEVDMRTRTVCVSFYDLEPVFYTVPEAYSQELTADSTATMPGTTLCRLALACGRNSTAQHKYKA